MTSARHPLPTDIVALVFDGRVYPNEAKPLESLGTNERAHPLEDAFEQWFSFATGKHTWVSVRGATIRGLISARSRAKRSAWEVDALIDADEDKGIALSLFSRMVAGVAKQRAERIFLRLDSESHLVQTAREAGFFPYARETLYERQGNTDGPNVDGKTADGVIAENDLRPRVKGDLFGVFQLYNQSVPANVRAIEGATFREWQAAQESWGTRPTDFLTEEDGIITAWLRVAGGQIGRFGILNGSGKLGHDELVRIALVRLNQSQRVQTLVRDDNQGFASVLERFGFSPHGTYTLMAKRLVDPTEELAPEAASTAVPVG